MVIIIIILDNKAIIIIILDSKATIIIILHHFGQITVMLDIIKTGRLPVSTRTNYI